MRPDGVAAAEARLVDDTPLACDQERAGDAADADPVRIAGREELCQTIGAVEEPTMIKSLRDRCVEEASSKVLLPAMRRHSRGSHEKPSSIEKELRTLPVPLLIQLWKELFHVIDASPSDARVLAESVAWFLPLCANSDSTR